MLAHVLSEGEEAPLGVVPRVSVQLLVVWVQGLCGEGRWGQGRVGGVGRWS